MPSSDIFSLVEYASQGTGTAESLGKILGIIAGIGMAILLAILIVVILSIIANWIIFEKAGKKGWKALIPVLNIITLFKIAGVSPWLILAYFTVIIPGIGALISIGVTIYVYIKLAKAFGKGDGFTVGLILLNFIFMMILAFGNAKYQLNEQVTENA